MICASIVLAIAAGPQLPARDREPVLLAVTAGGVRVECVEGTRAGDLEIETPFGFFRSPTDPVAEVVDGALIRARLDPLRAGTQGDPSNWLEAVSKHGLLRELVNGANSLLEEDSGREDVYTVLESWGRQLDPAPKGLALERRTAWLWKQVLERAPAQATLVAAQLAAEVPPGENADYHRQISLADLQKGFEHRRAQVRRAAVRVAGQQKEFELLVPLLRLSVVDPAHAVRLGAAEACARVHRFSARQFWTESLARSRDEHRLQAAENLGRYGGPEAVDPLVFVLTASLRSGPGPYRFAERQIHLVRDRDLTHMTGGRIGSPDDPEVLFQGSSFKITIYGPELRDAILQALDAWAGRRTGRDAQAWADWYAEERKPASG